jgi:transposase-like protein
MEERVRMLAEYDSGNWSVSELCRRYGVCRDTFYAWRSRRDSGVSDWFLDRSHAPLHCPHRTEKALKEEIVAMRQRFPDLGPRKLLAKLRRPVRGCLYWRVDL